MGTLLWLGSVLLVIALVAYVVGAGGVAGMSGGVGRSLLWVFLVQELLLDYSQGLNPEGRT